MNKELIKLLELQRKNYEEFLEEVQKSISLDIIELIRKGINKEDNNENSFNVY